MAHRRRAGSARTRTSVLGASARSLIYADGASPSALIGNNNTNASPRWSLVSPQEIARVDVLYGPFSAHCPGNSIGAVVEITARLPDRLEATATAATSVQQFSQYGTRANLPAYETGVTLDDRFGPLSIFANADRVDSHAQPLLYVTATRPAAAVTAAATTGGYDDLNRNSAAIRVLGANAILFHPFPQRTFHADDGAVIAWLRSLVGRFGAGDDYPGPFPAARGEGRGWPCPSPFLPRGEGEWGYALQRSSPHLHNPPPFPYFGVCSSYPAVLSPPRGRCCSRGGCSSWRC